MTICASVDLLLLYLDFRPQMQGQIRCDANAHISLATAHPIPPSPCNVKFNLLHSRTRQYPTFSNLVSIAEDYGEGCRGKDTKCCNIISSFLFVDMGGTRCATAVFGGSCMLNIMSDLSAFTICVKTKWSLAD